MTDHIPEAGKMVPERCEPPEHLRGVDGEHFIYYHPNGTAVAGNPITVRWGARAQGWWAEHLGLRGHDPDQVAIMGWHYVSPVTTPAEVEALREKVKRAGQACFDAQQEALAARMDANEWCQKAQLWEDRVHRLRAEVASLRATLGHQPAAEGAEPIGCPIPGMCAAVTATATLRARVAELEAALREIAQIDPVGVSFHSGAVGWGDTPRWVKIARAALEGKNDA